jgi:hypothetical protein
MKTTKRTLTDAKAYRLLATAITKEKLSCEIQLDDAGEPYVEAKDGVAVYADIAHKMFYRNNAPCSIETLSEAGVN